MIQPDRHNRSVALPGWPRVLLSAALTLAGLLHLLLTPDHFEASALMGVGFAGAALAEFGLALAVLVKPMRLTYFAVIGVAAALIGLYAFNVMIGLPFVESGSAVDDGGHASDAALSADAGHADGSDDPGHAESGHHPTGLVLGGGEPVDAFGAATKLSELAAIGLAVSLLARRPPRAAELGRSNADSL